MRYYVSSNVLDFVFFSNNCCDKILMLRSLLVLIVKNEENDILEWICHHSLIGFEKIVIYDNESTDRTAEIIKYASQYFPVEYVLWKDDMHIELGANKQIAAYTYTIQKYRDSVEWISFLDADEFLIPPSGEKLDNLLDRMALCRSFGLNWMCFGSSHLEHSKNRLVLEAFVLRAPDNFHLNAHLKIFFKPRFALGISNPHYIEVGEDMVNLLGQPMQWSQHHGVVKRDSILQGNWRLHHYVTRSRAHWQRRMIRKQPSVTVHQWEGFKNFNQNDIVDYTAYECARKVWDRLSSLGNEYEEVHAIPSFYYQPMEVSSIGILCFLDILTADGIQGWSCYSLSDDVVDLFFYVDGVFTASTKCNLSRPDVKKSTINKEFVGFSCQIPIEYLDGKKHNLSIRDRYNRLLPFYKDGERVNECSFKSVYQRKVIGHVDEPINGNLRGWVAIESDTNPNQGVFRTGCHVLVCLGHVPIGSVLADEPRQDVATAYRINAGCGFTFTIPRELRDGTIKNFRLFLMPEMIELSGSPLQVELSLQDHFSKMVSVVNILHNLDNYLKQEKLQNPIMFDLVHEATEKIEDILPNDNFNTLLYGPWFCLHYKELYKRKSLVKLENKVLVSVICPVYRPVLADFRTAVWSVLNQTYKNIELILCDDGGGDEVTISEIKKIANQDSRVKFIINEKNRGISEATNSCLDLAKGDWIAFFDHDDVLVDCAIERMLAYDLKDKAQILYSDEDKIDDDGILTEPVFKPEWNYRYLLSCNYINHLTMVRKSLAHEVGHLRSKYNGAQDHDFLLRCVELVQPEQIVHIPEVLYHWRKTATSTASSTETKPYVIDAGIKAISDHLNRLHVEAKVDSYGKHSMYHVTIPNISRKSVAIIIPFKDQVHLTKKCVEHVIKYTKNHDIEIVLVDNNSQKEETLLYLKDISKLDNVTIINYGHPFNYSKINNLAAEKTSSEYIVFMNNDLFVMDDTWLDTMLGEMVIDPKVGAVGGKFLYENRMVQHCGVILGWMGVAGHAFSHESEFYPGYGARAWLPHQVSAVTAACMLIRRDVFEETGGFDEKELKVAFNDIDLCLKITELGYKIIVTPDFVAEHHESISRGLDDTPEKLARFNKEVEVMRKRWGKQLDNDPFYSPSLARRGKPYFDLVAFKET